MKKNLIIHAYVYACVHATVRNYVTKQYIRIKQ